MRGRTGDEVSIRGTLVVLLLLSVASWSGLAYFTYAYAPTAWARLLFLLLFLPAAFTTLAPLAYAFHARFAGPGDYPTKLRDATREAGFLTALLEIWAGLRMIEALNWISMLIMLGIVVLAEVLILLKGK
jgi:hypothetical protein